MLERKAEVRDNCLLFRDSELLSTMRLCLVLANAEAPAKGSPVELDSGLIWSDV